MNSSLTVRICHLLLGLCLFLTGLFSGHGLAETPTEYKVKAAFLYHFVQFAEWPEQAFPQKDSRIHVCNYGQDSFEGLLQKTFDGKSVKSRRFRVQPSVTAEEIQDCHVLFVNRMADITKKDIQRLLPHTQALLVGETEDFLEYGGMIQFYEADKKIRFAVNPDSLERHNIHLSSKLLRLAKIVRSE